LRLSSDLADYSYSLRQQLMFLDLPGRHVATLIARDLQDRLHSPKQHHSPLEVIMQQSSWTTPDFEEISLNCEINSYAPVEL